MKARLGRVLKLVSVGVLAAGVAGLPALAGAHDRDRGRGGHVVVVPKGGGHYKSHRAYRHYRPRVVERVYRYREPYYVYQPYYVAPRVYDYGYAPVYPGGNLSLTLDFPFRF
jgi:hypothetical protein